MNIFVAEITGLIVFGLQTFLPNVIHCEHEEIRYELPQHIFVRLT